MVERCLIVVVVAKKCLVEAVKLLKKKGNVVDGSDRIFHRSSVRLLLKKKCWGRTLTTETIWSGNSSCGRTGLCRTRRGGTTRCIGIQLSLQLSKANYHLVGASDNDPLVFFSSWT